MKNVASQAVLVWQQFTAPSTKLDDPIERQLSRLLAIWLLFFLLVLAILFVVRFPFGISSAPETWVRLLLVLFVFVAYLLNRQGYFRLATPLIIGVSTLAVLGLALLEVPRTGLQILNYLVVITFFASMFYLPSKLLLVQVGHLASMIVYGLSTPAVSLMQVVDGPISFNLTMALVVVLVTHQRGQLEASRRQAIDRERRLFRHLATYSPDTIWLLDGAERRLTLVNQSAFLDYPAAVLQNLDAIRALVHEADLAAFDAFYGVELESGAGPDTFESRLQRKNGRYEWVQTRIIALPSEDGQHGHRFLCLMTVDTERKRAAAARQNESLSTLAGGVAHDFNNLLVAVQSQLSLTAHKLSVNKPVEPHIEKARSAADRIEAITAKLLAFSGHGRFVMQSVCLPEMIAENFTRLQATLPENITVERQFSPDVALIEADPHQLKQILLNLFFNAVEAIGAGPGVISVSVEMAHVETLDHSFTGLLDQELAPGRYVAISVADNGSGIDPETAVRIFEPFFTTKELGRGLGLPAVWGIVRSHDGAVTVQSKVGVGTRVSIYLPPLAAAAKTA